MQFIWIYKEIIEEGGTVIGFPQIKNQALRALIPIWILPLNKGNF